jgi:uncharacterized protein YggE
MKTRWEYGIIGLLTALLIWLPAAAGAQNQPPARSMDVTGQAVVSTEPDLAVASFTVETSSAKAASTLKENSRITQGVIRALKQAAGPGAEVSTSRFSLQPVYGREKKSSDQGGGHVPEAYRVTNAISVKTSRVDGLGELIDAAAAAGATRVHGITFSRSDSDELQRQAAETALKNAVENAEVLAKAAGVRLKGITYIQFVPTMMQPGGARITMAEGDSLTPVIPGQISFESYVNLTYELE